MYKKVTYKKVTTATVAAGCTVCMLAGVASAEPITPSPQVPRISPSPQAAPPAPPAELMTTPGVSDLPQAPPAVVWRQTPPHRGGTDNGAVDNSVVDNGAPETFQPVILAPAPPDLLGSGASTIPRPDFVPRDVAKWANGWLDYGNSIVDGIYTAGGMPPDQAERLAAGTTTGAAAGVLIGGATGAIAVGVPLAVIGGLAGGTVGGVIGATAGVAETVATLGIGLPVGVTTGIAGTAIGAGIGAVVLGGTGAVLGGVTGAAVGGLIGGVTGAALSGGHGNPEMPSAPLPPLVQTVDDQVMLPPAASVVPQPAAAIMPQPAAEFDVAAATAGVNAWAAQQADQLRDQIAAAANGLAGMLPVFPA